MSNRNFTPEEIRSKVELFHAFRADGMRVYEISRRLGVTDTTIYTGFGNMTPPLLKKTNLRG